MTLAEQMRAAADTLELASRLYGSHRNPAAAIWTARRLRYEADVLERPLLTEEAPQ